MANKDLWVQLHKQVTTLKRYGINVAFWQVPRLRNNHADQLANDALIKQLPAVYPYPRTRKRKREDDEDAVSSSTGPVWVDTSTTSDLVWKHHHALAHLDLGIFKRTLRFYGHINDITEGDIQAKIDSNERCQSCFARGAKHSTAVDGDQREEPVAKRAKVEEPPLFAAVAVAEPSVPDAESTLSFARGFEFDFERPSSIVF